MNNQETQDLNVLSIDAWRDSEGGYSWNQWYKIDTITKEDFEKLNTNRKILKWARDNGIVGEESKGKLAIDDDQYNVVICEKSTMRPLYAIEYGPVYN